MLISTEGQISLFTWKKYFNKHHHVSVIQFYLAIFS